MMYIIYVMCCFFFFKQKTAYEMRISDWSSDVCSSDLAVAHRIAMGCHGQMPPAPRRRGLYERISDRACLARGAGVAHLWRHQRDHEGADRPEPVTEKPARTFTVQHADAAPISVPFDPRAPFGQARPPVVATPNG